MPSLRLNLDSPVVDLAVRWMQEEKLPNFKLRGCNDLETDLLAEDVAKKQEVRLSDFQDPHGGQHFVSVHFDEILTQAQVAELSQALKQDTHTAELRLCGLPEEAVPALSRAASSLRSLHLAGCGLTDASSEHLGQLLQVSETLCKLSLENNRLGCGGAACLAAGLQSNDFLCELNLRQNVIADEGCTLLAEALQVNPYVLETLDVSENAFEEAGQLLLESAFWTSCSLGALHLGRQGEARRTLEKSPTAAVGLEGAPPVLRTTRPGFAFVVHCHGLGAEIWAEDAEGAASSAGKLVDMQQDDKDLDLVFSVPRLEPKLATVSLTADSLKITAMGQTLVDLQLFSSIDPSLYDLSSRDSILEVSLTKANRGELWPRLEK